MIGISNYTFYQIASIYSMGITRTDLYTDVQVVTAKAFSIISNPCRLKIILILLVNEDLSLGEIKASIGDLSQSSVSDQVKKLKDFGLLNCYNLGTSTRYSLNTEAFDNVINFMRQFLEIVSTRD